MLQTKLKQNIISHLLIISAILTSGVILNLIQVFLHLTLKPLNVKLFRRVMYYLSWTWLARKWKWECKKIFCDKKKFFGGFKSGMTEIPIGKKFIDKNSKVQGRIVGQENNNKCVMLSAMKWMFESLHLNHFWKCVTNFL